MIRKITLLVSFVVTMGAAPVQAQPELWDLVSSGLSMGGRAVGGAIDLGSAAAERGRRNRADQAYRDSRRALEQVGELEQRLAQNEQARHELEQSLRDRQQALDSQGRALVAISVRQAQTEWERIQEAEAGSLEQRRRMVSAMTFEGYRNPVLMRDDTFRQLRTQAISTYVDRFGSPELKELARIAGTARPEDRTQIAMMVSERLASELQHVAANPQHQWPAQADGLGSRVQRAVDVQLETTRLLGELRTARQAFSETTNPEVPSNWNQVTSLGRADDRYREQRQAYVAAHSRLIAAAQKVDQMAATQAETAPTLRVGGAPAAGGPAAPGAATAPASDIPSQPEAPRASGSWTRTLVGAGVGGVGGVILANVMKSTYEVVERRVAPGFFSQVLHSLTHTQARDKIVQETVRVAPKAPILAAFAVGGAVLVGLAAHWLSKPAVDSTERAAAPAASSTNEAIPTGATPVDPATLASQDAPAAPATIPEGVPVPPSTEGGISMDGLENRE